jgi:hypothetical protein
MHVMDCISYLIMSDVRREYVQHPPSSLSKNQSCMEVHENSTLRSGPFALEDLDIGVLGEKISCMMVMVVEDIINEAYVPNNK